MGRGKKHGYLPELPSIFPLPPYAPKDKMNLKSILKQIVNLIEEIDDRVNEHSAECNCYLCDIYKTLLNEIENMEEK